MIARSLTHEALYQDRGVLKLPFTPQSPAESMFKQECRNSKKSCYKAVPMIEIVLSTTSEEDNKAKAEGTAKPNHNDNRLTNSSSCGKNQRKDN